MRTTSAAHLKLWSYEPEALTCVDWTARVR